MNDVCGFRCMSVELTNLLPVCGHVELRTRLLEEIASLHDLVKAKMREMQTMRLEFSAELQETEVRRP